MIRFVRKMIYEISYILTIRKESIQKKIKQQRLKGLLLYAVSDKLGYNSFKLITCKKYAFYDAEIFRIYQMAAYIFQDITRADLFEMQYIFDGIPYSVLYVMIDKLRQEMLDNDSLSNMINNLKSFIINKLNDDFDYGILKHTDDLTQKDIKELKKLLNI